MTELLQGRNPLDLIKPRPRLADRTATEPPATGRRPTARPTQPKPAAAPDDRDPDDPGPDYPGDPRRPRRLDDRDPGYAGPDGAPAWTAEEADNARHTDDPTTPPNAAGRCAPPSPPRRPPTSTSSSPSAPSSAGPPPPPKPEASASSTPTKPAPSSRPRPGTPEPAGPSPSPTPPGARSPTAAPAASTPGNPHPTSPRTREHRHREPHHRTPTRPPGSATSSERSSIIFDPIAQDTCDHRSAENRYTPSRKLKDLIRARTITCDAPGCNAQALYCDLDHTIALPRRPDRPVQPRPQVQTPPSRQAGTRLAGRATRARHHPLDPAQRPHPHHHPHHLRLLTARPRRGQEGRHRGVRRRGCIDTGASGRLCRSAESRPDRLHSSTRSNRSSRVAGRGTDRDSTSSMCRHQSSCGPEVSISSGHCSSAVAVERNTGGTAPAATEQGGAGTSPAADRDGLVPPAEDAPAADPAPAAIRRTARAGGFREARNNLAGLPGCDLNEYPSVAQNIRQPKGLNAYVRRS